MDHVFVTINNKPYELFFGTKSARVFKAITGRNLEDLQSMDVGVADMVALLAAGVAKNHPRFTIDELESEFDAHIEAGYDVQQIADKLSEALQKTGPGANPTKATSTPISDTTASE